MVDLVIIGGGPAGMSAAISAYDSGVRDILILEREEALGGVLKQCIHTGFGLHKFNEELSGPEYAIKYEDEIKARKIKYKLNTAVINVTNDKIVTATNSEDGIFEICAKTIIFAVGCRERPKGALNISGARPAGIYSAGTAQRLINIDGYMPGENVVILGSGDIGLIMARRMTLEGAKVCAVCEVMPYSSGLARNIEQCLNDFDIPLKLSCTVVKIHGKERIEGVTVCKVDENRRPIAGCEEFIPCDTLLLSVGLIPETELMKKAGIDIDAVTNGAIVNELRETSVGGIFACGNVLHVHDLVDFVSEEAEIAGIAAAEYLKQGINKSVDIKIRTDGKIRYTVPQSINKIQEVKVYFRVNNVYNNVKINVISNGETILSKKKRKVAPGEMESIVLTEKLLCDVCDLRFELEEEK